MEVAVSVGVDVEVGVGVCVGVDVSVDVNVGVEVGVKVCVGVDVGVKLFVGVDVSVDVNVGVEVGLKVFVGVDVGVEVWVAVEVLVEVGVDVCVLVGVGVGVAPGTVLPPPSGSMTKGLAGSARQSKVDEFGCGLVELQLFKSTMFPAVQPRSVIEIEHSTAASASAPQDCWMRSVPRVLRLSAQLAELPVTSTSLAQVVAVVSAQVKKRTPLLLKSSGLPTIEKHRARSALPFWFESTNQQPSRLLLPVVLFWSKSKRR
jgi:hypothetical protein